MVRISFPPAVMVLVMMRLVVVVGLVMRLVVVKMLVVSGLILSLKVAIWRKQFS